MLASDFMNSTTCAGTQQDNGCNAQDHLKKRRRPEDGLGEGTTTVVRQVCFEKMDAKTEVSKRRHQEMESQGKRRKLVLQMCFDKVGMNPVAEAEAEAEAEAAAAAQEVAKAWSRTAYQQEEGSGPTRGRRKRTEKSNSLRNEQRDELVQKKRLDDGGRAAAGVLMLMHAVEPEEEAAPRACEFCPAATCSGLGSLLSEVELLGGFPLRNLPEELQLLIAAQVAAPRDRAALCIAVPPLGRKAIKEIKAYKGPLMSLGNRVLSGGGVGEAEVRRYVREFAPSEAAHPSLALNEYAELNSMAAPSARVRSSVQGSSLEWRLESGALLRCWKPFEHWVYSPAGSTRDGEAGMHHYEGAAGAERLVKFEFADGEVYHFRGEKELFWQRRKPTEYCGYYRNVDIGGHWDYGFWHPWPRAHTIGEDLRALAWKLARGVRPLDGSRPVLGRQ